MQSNRVIKTALIDADIMMYRAAWKHEGDDIEMLYETIDSMFEHIFHATKCTSYIGFITGKGNFRKRIAKTKPYKGNRKDMIIPEHLDNARDYLVNQWSCEVVNGIEADDALGICQTEMEDTCICSIDKDLLQIMGCHYNWNKSEFYDISEDDAWMKLYEQALMGDSTDNIVGVPRIGQKTAKKMLSECYSSHEALLVTINAYGDYYKDDNHLTMFQENFDLVKICTEADDSRLSETFEIPSLNYVF
tara:strand:- start:267 stop:1007 length:741 start_codon:yes stop_codon:yes gene_type:complete